MDLSVNSVLEWVRRKTERRVEQELARLGFTPPNVRSACAEPRPAAPTQRGTQFGVSVNGLFTPSAFGDVRVRGVFAKEGEDNRTVCLESGRALTAQLTRELERGWELISVAPPTASNLPQMADRARVYQSIRPEKVILDEHLIATFSNANRGDATVAVMVDGAADLILVSAFLGAKNCFPTAPDVEFGISGPALASAGPLGWPTINGGLDLAVSLAVRPSAIHRVPPPEGYTVKDMVSLTVQARVNLFGTLVG